MKLFGIVLSLLTAFLAIGPAEAMLPGVTNWRGKCWAKNAAVSNAIGHFCEGAGLSNHVPRSWTEYGVSSDSKISRSAHVAIMGNCSPQQWVPKVSRQSCWKLSMLC